MVILISVRQKIPAGTNGAKEIISIHSTWLQRIEADPQFLRSRLPSEPPRSGRLFSSRQKLPLCLDPLQKSLMDANHFIAPDSAPSILPPVQMFKSAFCLRHFFRILLAVLWSHCHLCAI
jgi:hypothetical protein